MLITFLLLSILTTAYLCQNYVQMRANPSLLIIWHIVPIDGTYLLLKLQCHLDKLVKIDTFLIHITLVLQCSRPYLIRRNKYWLSWKQMRSYKYYTSAQHNEYEGGEMSAYTATIDGVEHGCSPRPRQPSLRRYPRMGS